MHCSHTVSELSCIEGKKFFQASVFNLAMSVQSYFPFCFISPFLFFFLLPLHISYNLHILYEFQSACQTLLIPRISNPGLESFLLSKMMKNVAPLIKCTQRPWIFLGE